MPRLEEHLRLAQQFRKFLEEANPLRLPGKQIELAVASCYWSALHYIDAVLALPEINRHPDSEGARIQILSKGGAVLSAVVKHQRYLKDRYDDVMYRGIRITDSDFSEAVSDSYRNVVQKMENVLRGQQRLP
jgi:hypothetical protein